MTKSSGSKEDAIIIDVTLPTSHASGIGCSALQHLCVHSHEWLCVITWSSAWYSVNIIVLITLPWNLSSPALEASRKP